jgi:predicted N-acetyltransferase YhbS
LIVHLGPLTAAQKAELEGDERDPFDAAGSSLTWRQKDHHVCLQDERGRLVASTGYLTAEIETGGARFAVVGIGGVIVNKAHRGRGLAREVAAAALERAAALGPDFAVLFCYQDRAGLYRKLGFSFVAAEVTVEQPGGYALMAQRTMWRGLREAVRWPDGAVAVHSLPW